MNTNKNSGDMYYIKVVESSTPQTLLSDTKAEHIYFIKISIYTQTEVESTTLNKMLVILGLWIKARGLGQG